MIDHKRSIHVVITMAGKGERFKKAGFTEPKHKIVVRGKSLFEWSMSSLTSFYDEHFVFAVREENEDRPFLEQTLEHLGINNYEIIILKEDTKGQAETAFLAIERCDPEMPVLIYNIDTYVRDAQLSKKLFKGEGFIPCFLGEGDHWSFVKTDSNNRVALVTEKVRISPYCSIGAYYFSTANLYRETYIQFYRDDSRVKEVKEQYIAPMYNKLIDIGNDVRYCVIDDEFVHVLGTPNELEQFCAWITNER